MTSSPAVKLIPSVILFVTFGYLCWPYLEPARPIPPAPTRPSQITTQLLAPAQPPQAARDPFGDSLAFELGETTDEKPGRGKPGRPLSPKAAAVGKQDRTGRKALETRTAVREGTAPVFSAAKADTEPANDSDDLRQMVLSATLLRGSLRSALINGQVYEPGDMLELSEAKTPFKVQEIHHHRVVLERGGKRLELKYPQIAVADNAPNAGGAKDASEPVSEPAKPAARPANPQPAQGR